MCLTLPTPAAVCGKSCRSVRDAPPGGPAMRICKECGQTRTKAVQNGHTSEAPGKKTKESGSVHASLCSRDDSRTLGSQRISNADTNVECGSTLEVGFLGERTRQAEWRPREPQHGVCSGGCRDPEHLRSCTRAPPMMLPGACRLAARSYDDGVSYQARN